MLSSDNSENIDLVLFHQGLDPLSMFLDLNDTDEYNIKRIKEALWCLSNITAGSEDQIKSFLEHESIMEKVFRLMLSKTMEIRREATITITNLLTISENTSIHRYVTEFKNFEIISIFA